MVKEHKRNDSAQLFIEWVRKIKILSDAGINTTSKREKNEKLAEIRGACEAVLITLNNTIN